MVNALVDTSVVIDLLRGYPPAQAWYLRQTDLGVSRAVWLEVLEGTQNRHDQRQALKLLKRFYLDEMTEADGVWATDQLLGLSLSHNIDAFDCLIAASSHRLNVTLYTRNLKHFVPLLGGLAQSPY
ncbi:MAG: PIN domain-containing protein [Anaerolineae bacterium]|nr:PIN domain-containing protein [Anaerolineae bacterium]